MKALDQVARASVTAVIDAHRAQLSTLDGFIDAEPGYPLVDGRFVREPAVIILVRYKRPADALLPEQRMPRQLGPYRVCVMQADPERQMSVHDDFVDAVDAMAAMSANLRYEPPSNETIRGEFEIERPFLCHVGPDAGWPVLKPFLETTKSQLTVAMYDFNADYIVKTFTEMIRHGDVAVNLSWDNGMTADEQKIRESLRALVGEGLTAWLVQCGQGRRFASAYHEKVAVRDHRAFWLSSGNWSRRSQPNIDPVGVPAEAKGMFGRGNREWHVICEDKELSEAFEQYILHDMEASREEFEQGQAGAELDLPVPIVLPDILVPLDALMDRAMEFAAPVEPAQPALLPSNATKVTVQPVLTPDNYLEEINKLIDSATSSIYLQFAYINWSDREEDELFRNLLLKLAELSGRQDLDTRIIIGNADAPGKIRKLVEAGFSQDVFRVQTSIHNKGIIVDGRAVLISSTNWSADGVLRNRDAGLIIHHEEVAGYYQGIFLDDWDSRARSRVEDTTPTVIASASEPTPPGMVRMSWNEYFG